MQICGLNNIPINFIVYDTVDSEMFPSLANFIIYQMVVIIQNSIENNINFTILKKNTGSIFLKKFF